MPIPIKNKTLADEFIAALKANDGADATRKLMTLGAEDGMAALLLLIKSDPEEKLKLILRASAYNFTNTRLGFFINVACFGFPPLGTFAGVDGADYQAARLFIMNAREGEKALTDKAWGNRREVAAKHRFYPEFAEQNLRKRICQVAEAHVGKGPGNVEQMLLFSLGAAFDKLNSTSATKPVGTTCVLFARAAWHAAGINVVHQDTKINLPDGLYKALPYSKYGYSYFSGDEFKSMKEGDIFHIKGDDKKGENDSSHVGLIVKATRDGDDVVWDTIEGGADNHVTQRNQRKVIKQGNGYALHNDDKHRTKKFRKLTGYFDVWKVAGDRLMDKAAAVETGKN